MRSIRKASISSPLSFHLHQTTTFPSPHLHLPINQNHSISKIPHKPTSVHYFLTPFGGFRPFSTSSIGRNPLRKSPETHFHQTQISLTSPFCSNSKFLFRITPKDLTFSTSIGNPFRKSSETHVCRTQFPLTTPICSNSKYPFEITLKDPIFTRPFSSSSAPDPPMDSKEPNSQSSSPIPVVSTFASPFDSSPTHINAGSMLRKPLSLWPGMYHSPVTNALWEARSSIFECLLEPSKDAPSQSELLTKTPSQSRTSIVYHFSNDFILREQYRDPWNKVRIGKLLEDLDALAGTIAVKHCSNNDSMIRPLVLVTAAVDKMVLKKPLHVDSDLKIAGAVAWVGRSSIELKMEITQSEPADDNSSSDPIVLTANFTFVARDSNTGKSAPVNRLSPESETEKALFEEGEARDRVRKRKQEEKKSAFVEGAHVFHGEVKKLKALLAEGRVFCDMPALADRDSILIRDTRLENSLICHPQQRNIHGRIFGGFLMHRAFELAFSTAYAFAGQMPCFLEVDHVDFLRPVDVGDFLRFKSCVLYTELENPEQPLINIEVVAHVTRPELRTSEVSNTFYFTFTVSQDGLKNGLRIRNVVPSTEEEARHVLERIDAEKSYFVNSRAP